jgi:L-serine dehydratase
MIFRDVRKIFEQSSYPLHEAFLKINTLENGSDQDVVKDTLSRYLRTIIEENEKNFGKKQNTLTGFTGWNAFRVYNYKPKLMGEFLHTAVIAALSTNESNAAMGRIVACPTAGASGVMAGTFFALYKVCKFDFDKLLDGFVVSGGIGDIIASKATLSGAAGGCQAEIGSAVAMAAAGLCYILGGGIDEVESAAALSLKSLMGLICDPVGGYVEIPCVKRNATGVAIAMTEAELALAGVRSAISFDDTVIAMKKVGASMQQDLKETGRGGIASTPSARKLVEKIPEVKS